MRSLKASILTVATITGLALCSAVVAAPLEIVGLFKDRAVVRVHGNNRVLKIGERSPEGALLLSADARGAVVDYEGERHTLSLSDRVAGTYTEVTKQRVSIPSDKLGQYRIRGAINDHYVNFLVDTGASVVALSSATADSMGLDYNRGQKGQVVTAQGTAESFFVILDEVNVAGIAARNVQAAVITGSYPVEILLGMSFLRQVSMEESGGVMTLMQQY